MTTTEDIPPRTYVPAVDGLFTVEETTYHGDRGSLSFSGAKLLLPPSCPAKFREHMDNPPPPKRVYEFGHLVHKLVLGEGLPTVELDFGDYRTKAAREARDAARAEGKIPVLVGAGANDEFRTELAKAQAMAGAVLAHPEAGELFLRGHAEKSMYWTDPETGVRLRGRADWLTLSADDRLTCVDLKTGTTSNPAELERKFWQFGYHIQDAWYRRLLAETMMTDPDFAFVVVEKDPPYLVSVVRYDAESRAEGWRQARTAIDTYVQCMETGAWPGYTDRSVEISLPGWAFPRPQTLGDLIAADHYIYDTDPLSEEYQ